MGNEPEIEKSVAMPSRGIGLAAGLSGQSAPDVSGVASESLLLDDYIQSLHKAVDTLEEKLRPICVPRDSNLNTTVEPPSDGYSPLRRNFFDKSISVRGATNRLYSLMDAIEL